MSLITSIQLINQIHHQRYDDVLFLRLTLGDHEGNGDQRVVGDAFAAVIRKFRTTKVLFKIFEAVL